MKTWITVIVLAGLALAALALWSVCFRANRKHDPMEYYAGWGGYWHPIGLSKKITREQADAIAARGNAYLIGFFDADNRLIRVDKILRGELFFRFEYAYYPDGMLTKGRLRLAKVSRHDRQAITFEYDKRGRKLPGSPGGFW
jgi:hypothetical protein